MSFLLPRFDYSRLMLKVRSPGRAVFVAAYMMIVIGALVIFTALRMPALGVSFATDGQNIEMKAGRASTVAHFEPTDQVTFAGPAGTLEQSAGELVPDFEPSGSATEIKTWFAQRDALAKIGAHPPITLSFQTGGVRSRILLAPVVRSIRDLSADIWMLLAQGVGIGLLGLWLIILRPRDWGARMFMVSCLGVMFAAFSGAVYDARELTADWHLLRLMLGLNFIGSYVSGAGILALFLCQPRQLVKPRYALLLVGVSALCGVANAAGWLSLAWFYEILLGQCAVFLCVLVVQWRLARHDPISRATLKWVGSVLFILTLTLTLFMAAPNLLGVTLVAGDGLSILPVFLGYGGLAFGVGRFRLLSFERWTHRIILGAIAVLALLVVDMLLITWLSMEGRAAFAASFLLIGYLYLPVRNLLWHLMVGRPALSDSELFRSCAKVAYAPAAQARRNEWQTLLSRLFDPLEILPAVNAIERAEVREDGVEIAIPAAADERALLLRYREGGRRLFDAGNILLVTELVAQMNQAEAAREEYARGVGEERQRIARDLHDDVSARLLTSLHRSDVALVRADVRRAMADIRAIISSLTGQKVALDRVMADLRHDTAERLEAAKISLVWPLSDDPVDARLLAYPTYKGLMSSHREIISNVIRHSGADRVLVEINAHDTALSISVEDNGSGLGDSTSADHSGNGISNMRHRIEQIDGRFSIVPCAHGTRVEVLIPLT